MELIRIEVECHSGFKADEYPKSFTWYEKEYEIVEIVDRWYQMDLNPDVPAADYYKVKADDRGQYIIKKDKKSDEWYLVI